MSTLQATQNLVADAIALLTKRGVQDLDIITIIVEAHRYGATPVSIADAYERVISGRDPDR